MFGAAPVVGKIALAAFPSNAIVSFRVGGAALAFLILQSLTGSLRLERRSDYGRIAVFSLLGVVCNQLLFFNGLRMTTATNTALLAVLIPVFAVMFSTIFGFDKLTPLKLVGIIVAACGVVYLINPAAVKFSLETVTGDLVIVVNCLFYASYIALSKETVARNGALKTITWMFLFGAIICVPLGAYALKDFDFAAVSFASWQSVFYLVVFQTITAYFLNAWALAKVAPSVVAAYIYLQPLIGFTLAVLFLGEHFTVRSMAAAFLIFVGVFFATRKRSSEKDQTLAHETFH